MSERNLLSAAVVMVAALVSFEPTHAQQGTSPTASASARKPEAALAACLQTAMRTDEINACMKAARARGEAEMDKAYAALSKELETGAEQDLLMKSQRAWLAYRDAECLNYAGPQDQGGSLWSADVDGCYAQKANDRAAELNFDANPQEGASPRV